MIWSLGGYIECMKSCMSFLRILIQNFSQKLISFRFESYEFQYWIIVGGILISRQRVSYLFLLTSFLKLLSFSLDICFVIYIPFTVFLLLLSFLLFLSNRIRFSLLRLSLFRRFSDIFEWSLPHNESIIWIII